jgi:hypothetical protein
MWLNISVGYLSSWLCAGLAGIVGDGGDVNQFLHAVIHSRGCDRGSAVRVTHEDRGAAHPPQRAFHCGHILRERVEAVLDGNHVVSVGLQCGNYLVEA